MKQPFTLIRLGMLLCIMVATSSLFAHEGGHFHLTVGDQLHEWKLASGQSVYGNYIDRRDGMLYLEGFEGKRFVIPVESLSEKSRRTAEEAYQRFSRLNGFILQNDTIYTHTNTTILGLMCVLLGVLLVASIYLPSRLLIPTLKSASLYLGVMLFFVGVLIACKKDSGGSGSGAVSIPKTRTTFLDSAFAPYRPAVGTSFDNTYYYISSSGWPAHNMMVGITSWQQQVPVPQFYTGFNHWSVPLQPVFATTPLSTRANFMKGAVALAVNGIPIFNALNNRGVDSYATGELDQWGGHCGRADDYHYHAAPLHLMQTSGRMPIAFALDGFPVYGTMEPDGSATQSLDTCHGHQLSGQVYHYHGTTSYPYVIGAMRGRVTTDPNTPAPENQILPQAFASPVRPATSPLNGVTITDFISTGTNAYKLTYRIGIKVGYVEYSWTTGNLYTYKLTDTAGVITINTYQR